jgi:hypothetical protein
MPCEERMRLLTEYRNAAYEYSVAVAELVETIALDVDSRIDLLRGACRSAWDQVEKARIAVSRHESDHLCDRVSSALKL